MSTIDTNTTPEQQPQTPDIDPGGMADTPPAEEGMPEDMAMDEQMLAEQCAEAEPSDTAPTDEEMMLDEAMDAELDPAEFATDLMAGAVTELDPGTLTFHPYAELLPLMRPTEFERLKDSIELDGQLVPIVLFEGLVLDGRNRCRACQELGIPVKAQLFEGTSEEALLYVVAANQHRRDLDKTQRAVVAMRLIPMMSETVNEQRIEKIRRTLAAKRETEIMSGLTGSQTASTETPTTRAIAADLMGVSDGYVGQALQLQRDAPELFKSICDGSLTVNAAWNQFTSTVKPAITGKQALARKQFRTIMSTIGDDESRLDDLLDILKQFSATLTDAS